MIVTSQSIDIDRPIKEVFAFMSDVNNSVLWQPSVVEISATNGTQVGSIISSTSIGLGRKFEIDAKITVNNGRDHIESVSSGGPIDFTSTVHLEELPDGGTRLTMAGEAKTHGIFKMASGVLQAIAETRQKADLQQLKLVLENDIKVLT